MKEMSIIAKAVLRQPVMNKLETAYAWVLQASKMAGDILFYRFGCVTLLIGQDCRFTPDFMVINKDSQMELHEVKGFMRDDAMVKLKAAAAAYPFIFKLARRVKGEWTVEDIGA